MTDSDADGRPFPSSAAENTRTGPPPGSVKRALRSLADGTAPRGAAHEPIVDAATDALDDVETAAAFVAADGRSRLRRAISLAERRGDDRAAREGRRALSSLDRFRRAAAGTSVSSPVGPNGSADSIRTRPDATGIGPASRDGQPSRSDHFRFGRGTVLRGGGKGSDR